MDIELYMEHLSKMNQNLLFDLMYRLYELKLKHIIVHQILNIKYKLHLHPRRIQVYILNYYLQHHYNISLNYCCHYIQYIFLLIKRILNHKIKQLKLHILKLLFNKVHMFLQPQYRNIQKYMILLYFNHGNHELQLHKVNKYY